MWHKKASPEHPRYWVGCYWVWGLQAFRHVRSLSENRCLGRGLLLLFQLCHREAKGRQVECKVRGNHTRWVQIHSTKADHSKTECIQLLMLVAVWGFPALYQCNSGSLVYAFPSSQLGFTCWRQELFPFLLQPGLCLAWTKSISLLLCSYQIFMSYSLPAAALFQGRYLIDGVGWWLLLQVFSLQAVTLQ